MEELKKPPMVLGVVNSMAIIGMATYFYKQQEANQARMIQFQQSVASILARVVNLEKNEEGRVEVLRNLNEQIKRLNEMVEDTTPLAEAVDADLNAIVEILNSTANLDIERPSMVPISPPPTKRYDPRTRHYVDVQPPQQQRAQPRSQYYQQQYQPQHQPHAPHAPPHAQSTRDTSHPSHTRDPSHARDSSQSSRFRHDVPGHESSRGPPGGQSMTIPQINDYDLIEMTRGGGL